MTLFSLNGYNGKPFVDIVYEWEEDLSRALGAPVRRWGWQQTVASHLLRWSPDWRLPRRWALGRVRSLRFVMNAMDNTPLFNDPSCIPIIIDFFVKDADLPRFIAIYDKCEFVAVTSRQVYDRLMEIDLPFRLLHLPLTLSERHFAPKGVRYPKRHALTLLGTQIYDGTLRGYVERYKREHPDFIYIYQKEGTTDYVDDSGTLVAHAATREEYMDLLRATQVAVYTTPGIRGHRTTNGYDQVTPKFLEMLAAQCHVIPRYSDNSDTRWYELPKFAPSVESYEAFAELLDRYLAEPAPDYSEYLAKHSTRAIARIIEAGDLE